MTVNNAVLVPLEVARTPEESLGLKARVDSGEVPGFLLSPEVVQAHLGRPALELAGVLLDALQQSGRKVLWLDEPLLDQFKAKLRSAFGIEIGDPDFGNEAMVATTVENYNPHTDVDYDGGVLNLCLACTAPRKVIMSTVYMALEPKEGLSLEAIAPFHTDTFYEGIVEPGWATYFLASETDGNPRTLHQFIGDGAWARFGAFGPLAKQEYAKLRQFEQRVRSGEPADL